jgi:hypothetical protein
MGDGNKSTFLGNLVSLTSVLTFFVELNLLYISCIPQPGNDFVPVFSGALQLAIVMRESRKARQNTGAVLCPGIIPQAAEEERHRKWFLCGISGQIEAVCSSVHI